jgi:hypothetical protein
MLPLLLERAGVTTAWMQEVEQRMEQLPRRIKSSGVRQAKLVISCKVKVLAWNSRE